MNGWSGPVLVLAASLLIQAATAFADEKRAAARPAGNVTSPIRPPYPPSPVIRGIERDFKNLVRLAPGSDLWPTAWGPDGHIYTSWGDGGGFGGTNSLGRVSLGFARLEGDPANLKGMNLWGGRNGQNRATFTGKTGGMISVDGVLYAWLNMQDGSPPSKCLAFSADLGRTWQRSDWRFPKTGEFWPASFVNFGRDNAGARDEYVYSCGGKWVVPDKATDRIDMMRVVKSRIMDRDAYEFFAGLDAGGRPTWSADIAQRKPMFQDANGVSNCGLSAVVYSPSIKRYIMTVAHRPGGKTEMQPQVGCLGVFDAPEPWGPWTTVAYYDRWGDYAAGEALCYSFPAKWISKDGRTMWCVFSSTGHLDAFNLVKAALDLDHL